MKLFKKYGVYVPVLLGVVAIIMLFLSPAVKLVIGNNAVNWDVSGFQTIFGKEDGVKLDFNVLGFFALLLLVAGLAASLVPTIPPNLRYALSAVLLILSGIFFLIYPGTIQDNLKAATPIVLAGLFTLIGAVINGALTVVDVLKL